MKKIIIFFKKLALQHQKEASHQKGSAARQRATQEVLGPQLQRQAHRHLHERYQAAHQNTPAQRHTRLLP